jgi:lipopolysaccharide transport system permease protein
LVGLLALRDIQVRYKQTALGVLWAVMQPLVTMGVLSLLFGGLLGVGERVGPWPYPVFLFAGLVPWAFFAAAVAGAGNSLVNSAHLLGKVYFPRLVIPLAAVGAAVVDWLVALVALAGLVVGFGVSPGWWGVLLLPVAAGGVLVAALGVGVLLAALTVRYRDFRHVVPFMLQVWFFVTPVIVPAAMVPPGLRWLVHVNPIGGSIEAFRACVLGGPVDYAGWACSVGVSLALLGAGLAYFSVAERECADVV